MGCGVSGGEEGARFGPSLMPGGSPDAWTYLKPIFQGIAAKADGEPCCEWVGYGYNRRNPFMKFESNKYSFSEVLTAEIFWSFEFELDYFRLAKPVLDIL